MYKTHSGTYYRPILISTGPLKNWITRRYYNTQGSHILKNVKFVIRCLLSRLRVRVSTMKNWVLTAHGLDFFDPNEFSNT